MKLFDMNHDWFRPLWVRLLIVAFAGGWGVFEWSNGEQFWGIAFLAVAAYAAWSFFIIFDPGPKDDEDDVKRE